MLIVNADDWGRNELATDRILRCYAKDRITSASAMVFMADSERAAGLAQSSGLEVGLHLNLSEAFTGGSPSPEVREDHRRVRQFLKTSKYALLFYHPLLRAAFHRLFKLQYQEFVRLYGREPSHFDGHQHMHLATNMLAQKILPHGTKVRRSFSFQAGEKSVVNRWYRQRVDRFLTSRHRCTDYFFSVAGCMTAAQLQPVVTLARTANVELMVHPEIEKEHDFLMTEEYAAVISQARLAGFDHL